MLFMQIAAYYRQSQDRDGTGLGIDRQREEVRQLCKARGWKVAAEFVDNDVSALSRKPRPQFDKMMRRVEAGEFDVIVARHMDRLLRRLAELESTLVRCEKSGTVIVTAADGVDTGTDGGRLVARILASVAQGEVERKGARQKAAVVQAAKQGRWVGGRRAFGYEPDGVTVREAEAALIRQGYTDILAGESIDVYNAGWMQRDFTYIDDIVEGIVRVMERTPAPDPAWDGNHPDPATSFAPYKIYNIGNNQPVALLDFIATLEKSLGKKAKLKLLPIQPGDVPATYADVDDLMADVGFKPSTPIEEGIRKFVDWYRNYYQLQ